MLIERYRLMNYSLSFRTQKFAHPAIYLDKQPNRPVAATKRPRLLKLVAGLLKLAAN